MSRGWHQVSHGRQLSRGERVDDRGHVGNRNPGENQVVRLKNHRGTVFARIKARGSARAKAIGKLASHKLGLQLFDEFFGTARGARTLRVIVGSAVGADEEKALSRRHAPTVAHPSRRVKRSSTHGP